MLLGTMTMEPDTWTAELDSFGTSDDHFSHQQPVRKVASDGTDESESPKDFPSLDEFGIIL